MGGYFRKVFALDLSRVKNETQYEYYVYFQKLNVHGARIPKLPLFELT